MLHGLDMRDFFLSSNIRFEPFVIEIWQRSNCFTCQKVHFRQRDRWCEWSSCPLYPRPKAVLDSHCTYGWIGKKGPLFSGPRDRPISLLWTQIFSYVSEDGAAPTLTSQHIAEGSSLHSVRRDKSKSYVTFLKDCGIADISNIQWRYRDVIFLQYLCILLFSKMWLCTALWNCCNV